MTQKDAIYSINFSAGVNQEALGGVNHYMNIWAVALFMSVKDWPKSLELSKYTAVSDTL